MGYYLWFVAQSHLGLGDVDRALPLLERSVSLYEKAGMRVAASYIRADLEALRGDHEASIRSLNTAVSLGLRGSSLLTGDLALRSLRGTPEFEKLLAEVPDAAWPAMERHPLQ